jgi:DNA-3-methyladenine glycosylase
VRALPRRFYARGALDVAPELLNKVLVVGPCRGRIVEVEAYLGDDPASHSFRGPTARNAAMFGPPGHLYVYFTYGMHHCANVVTGPTGDGQAVLLRAVAPLAGVDEMRARRSAARREVDLANGPGKLCEAFGIGREMDGVALTAAGGVWIGDDGVGPPARPARSARVGITKATRHPWRWSVPGDPHVSRP